MLKHTEERTYGRSACKYIKSLFSFFLLKYKKLTIGVKARPSTKEEGEEEENKQRRVTVATAVRLSISKETRLTSACQNKSRAAGFGFILNDVIFLASVVLFFFSTKKRNKTVIYSSPNFKTTSRGQTTSRTTELQLLP